MAVSKRLRFEILRRDGHTCRYCGATAPEVPLRVDHVVPVALGGSDDPSNLVAACEPCNSGKSSVPADARMVDDITQDALRWAAAMRQAAQEFSDAIESSNAAYAAIDAVWYQGNRPANWTDSIDQFIRAGLPLNVIVKMAGVAQNKRGTMGYRWSYFCGCCWTRVRDMQERATELVSDRTIAPHQELPTTLSTTWTALDLQRKQDLVYEYVDLILDDAQIAAVACGHQTSGHCGDPICEVEYLTSLEWLAIEMDTRKFRDDAVIDAAEASAEEIAYGSA